MLLPLKIVRRRKNTSAIGTWGKAIVFVIALSWIAAIFIGYQPSLAVLTALGFLMAIAGLKKEGFGLWGVGMLCTMDAISRVLLLTGGVLRWNTFNYLLLAVILLSAGFLFKQKSAQSLILGIFLLVLVLWLVFSPELTTGVMTILNVGSFFGLLVYFARNNRSAEVWYWQGVILGVLAAGGSVVYYLTKEGLPYVNPNAWAYLPLTGMFAVCLGFGFAHRGGKGQLILMILAVVNFASVFLSGSRGALLVGAACMVFLTLTMRSVSQLFVYAIVILIIGGVTINEFTDQRAIAVHRLSKFLDLGERVEARTSGRSDLALGGWYIFLDNPFGVGTGGFGSAWAKLGYKSDLSGFRYGQEMAAHSGWINTLVDNGFFGFLLLVAFVFSFAATGWRRRRRGLFAIGLMASVVFSLALLSTQFASKGLWYLAAGSTVLLHMRSVRNDPVVRRAGGGMVANGKASVLTNMQQRQPH